MAVKKPLVLYSGIASELQSGDTLSATSTAAVVRSRTRFSATAGDTAFTVPTYSTGHGLVDVFINGSQLDSSTEFTETNSTTITLASGVETTGDIVVIITYAEASFSNYVTDENATAYAIALG
jgi:hypothetical protein